MEIDIAFREYEVGDAHACLELFDRNCPRAFSPNERGDYARFLDAGPVDYELATIGGRAGPVGAYGLTPVGPETVRLNWIMVDPEVHGRGLGTAMMARVVSRAGEAGFRAIEIAASQVSEPFFARFGAETGSVTADGWGPGMHRHDMRLEL